MLKIHGIRLSQITLSRLSCLRFAGITSCCALMILFGLMLFPSLPQETYAAPEPVGTPATDPSTGASVGISLPASIDFASVTPTPDGATTTATADLTVTTTNSASYSLYLYSSDGDNSLRPKIPSLANISKINATAGDVGLTISSLEPNTWGYNLGTSVPDDDTTYSAIPTDNSTPIQTKDTSSTYAANDTYTLSFGAKVDTSIPSGNYSNTLAIAVIAKPAFVTIAFDGNGADDGNMASLQMLPGGQQVLPNNTFVRSGYIFNGWNTAANGSGVSYADGASYAAPVGSSGQTVTLYAQWRLLINHLGDVTYMQDLTATHCSTSENGATATLIDRRDNNSYTVAKINGNCWMTQNLRLSGGKTLTNSDSNVASNWVFPSTQLAVNSATYTEPQMTISNNPSYGGYYNYCAVSAGTVCQDSAALDASQDICPKGWRLPTDSEMGGITSYTSAFSPVYSGYFYNNSLVSAGSRGSWWSSTALGTGIAQTVLTYLNSDSLVTWYGRNRDEGHSVRCIRSS